MLSFDSVKANPALNIISSGIRHVSTDIKVLEKCAAWTPQGVGFARQTAQRLSVTERPPSWVHGAEQYGITRLIFDDHNQGQLKADLRDGRYWFESEEFPEPLYLDHYFDCLFAGPLIDTCTQGFSQTDASTKDALILLDRIVNSPWNLAWIPKSLSEYKHAYFNGESRRSCFEYVLTYLEQR